MIKAVIFDLDGLIADTEIIESHALELLLKEYDKKPKYYPNGLIHIAGLAGDSMWITLKKTYAIDADITTLRNRKREIFEELIKKELKPYDGFIELLNILKKNRLKLALASNRFVKHIDLILEELGVTKYFDVVVGPSEKRRHKPHPDIYLETAKQLGIKPEFCLALEDTEHGINSAVAAGMKAIAIPNTYTKVYNFAHAKKVVNSLQSVTIELINSL